MKFYGFNHDYDIRVANDVRSVVRFNTKDERDQWVEDESPDRNGNYHREAVTRDEARRLFPKAFRLVDGDESDMSDWTEGTSYSMPCEIWYEDIREDNMHELYECLRGCGFRS